MKAPTEDQRLRTAVVEELDWDALVDASQLDASVDDHVVTLVGTVSSVAEKFAALRAVESVAGVHDVVSRVDVKVPKSRVLTDDQLERIVGQVLAWDALVPEQHLEHRVVDSWVTVTGTVPTARQRQEIDRVVGHITGTRGLTNEVTLDAPPLALHDVRGALDSALVRRAEHRSHQIEVIVDGADITLRGIVQSGAEKRAILGAVSHAAGVDEVHDELFIASSSSAG